MDILSQLASSLGRRDEVPNQELAAAIVAKKDTKAVAELTELLLHKKKDIRNDSIKVLYEIGEKDPKLIAPHIEAFFEQLSSNDNRMQWGAMTALDVIASVEPKKTAKHLKHIVSAADSGSVITRDHAVGILVKLLPDKQVGKDAFGYLIKQLQSAPENQIPMYAEMSMPNISEANKPLFLKTLKARLNGLPKESQKKRVEKVIKKMGG